MAILGLIIVLRIIANTVVVMIIVTKDNVATAFLDDFYELFIDCNFYFCRCSPELQRARILLKVIKLMSSGVQIRTQYL